MESRLQWIWFKLGYRSLFRMLHFARLERDASAQQLLDAEHQNRLAQLDLAYTGGYIAGITKREMNSSKFIQGMGL